MASADVDMTLSKNKLDKNINRDQVIALLVEFRCSITAAGGSHQKATAPNGAEWTIPREWDGPIPSGSGGNTTFAVRSG